MHSSNSYLRPSKLNRWTIFAGTNVNYNVNWTYGGDHSKPNKGYAALHGCQGDTVTFNFAGGPHNVVLLAGSVGSEARHYRSLLPCIVPDSLLSVVQEGLHSDFHSLHLFLATQVPRTRYTVAT